MKLKNGKINKIFESSSMAILDSKKLSKEIEKSITLIIK